MVKYTCTLHEFWIGVLVLLEHNFFEAIRVDGSLGKEAVKMIEKYTIDFVQF